MTQRSASAALPGLPTLSPLTRGKLASLELRDERVLRDFLLENLGRHLTRARDLYEALRTIEFLRGRGRVERLWRKLSTVRRPVAVDDAARSVELMRGLTRILLLHLCDWRYVEQAPLRRGEADGEAGFRAVTSYERLDEFLSALLRPQDGYDLRDTTRIYRSETSRFLKGVWLDPETTLLSARVTARFLPLADHAFKTETLFLDAGELVHAFFRLLPHLSEIELELVAPDPTATRGMSTVLALSARAATYRQLDEELLPQELPQALACRFNNWGPVV